MFCKKLYFILLLLCGSVVQAMPVEEARHLMARAGFGVNATDLMKLAGHEFDNTVEAILREVTQVANTPPPVWIDRLPPLPRERKNMSVEQRKELRYWIMNAARELKAWWYQEMIATGSPLTERMTLFLHNHFTSSVRKVRWPPLLYRQNVLLRRHALGNFRTLLKEIARDPAMLLYLDNARNRKDKNNENFTRELLELFTLGEGHYSEVDIREAARAFTGWTLNRKTAEFRVARFVHDDDEKIFMRRKGDFDGDDIIDIILDQPQAAIFITEKLWREFISPTPDLEEVGRLAGLFRKSNYEIKVLVREMLLSDHFRKNENRGVLIKSPVDLLVGTVRMLDIKIKDTDKLVKAGRVMGQDIFNPPNVRGWPGGVAWIDSNTLLIRQQIMEKIAGRAAAEKSPAVMKSAGRDFSALVSTVLLALPASLPIRVETRGQYIRELLMDPVYQLK